MTKAVGGQEKAASVSRSGRNSWLFAQVIFAIVAGAVLGHFDPELAIKMKPLGDLFIKIIKLVIPPVIFLTIVTGIAGGRQLNVLGKIAAKAIFYFLIMSTFALVVGLVAANILHPGTGLNVDPATLDTNSIKDYLSQAHDFTVAGFLTSIIPDSIVGALVGNNILQVVFIAILIGMGFSMAGERARPAVAVLESMAQGVFYVVQLLMSLAPIGSFGAMAFTIGKFGLGAIINLLGLLTTFYLTAAIFIIVVLGGVSAVCGFSIFRLLNYLRDELFLVLGTSSSESVLSSLMEKLEVCGCPRSIVGLVVPAGYSFNLDGTNIYMSLAALFIAQAVNIHLSVGSQLSLLAVAMVSSKGAAGVTGAGFITLAATLSIVPSVPIGGMALILGVDRFMSQCRALTNCIGNAVATIVVSRWQGELDVARLRRVLAGEASKIALEEGLPA